MGWFGVVRVISKQLVKRLFQEAKYFEMPVATIRILHRYNKIEFGVDGRYMICTMEFLQQIPPHEFWQRFINGKWP